MLISMISLLVAFVAFPESTDAILAHHNPKEINIETSGSLGIYHHGKCHKTYGNETLLSDEYKEWCSNIAADKTDMSLNPFIQYSIKGKSMKIKKYSVRNGCCRYECCCVDDSDVIEYYCCCRIYSYSLQGSNDNKTWTVLHKVEKDNSFYYCSTKTFDLPKETIAYTFLRFVLDKEWPGCPKCMQINQIELYGETISSGFSSFNDNNNDDDESISIIGRIKKGDQ